MLISHLLNIEVATIPNGRLNKFQGVVTCRSLQICSDKEILEELRDQKVIKVQSHT